MFKITKPEDDSQKLVEKNKEVDNLVKNNVSELKLRRLLSILSSVFLVVGGFVFLRNITGNVVGSSNSNVLGAMLIILGLVGVFMFVRRRE